jgi:hypothetical protein
LTLRIRQWRNTCEHVHAENQVRERHSRCIRLITAVQPLFKAVGATIVSVEDAQVMDIAFEWEGEIIAAVRLPRLHGALERLMEQVEQELGAPLDKLSRHDKQRAIRLLDQNGAFILRRAVEDVADAMGVSRITVYNYLNALHR